MRRYRFVLVLALAAGLQAQTSQSIEFGAKLADWNFAELTGDGRVDILAILAVDGGRFRMVAAVQKEDGAFAIGPPFDLPADVITYAMGTFTRDHGSDLALLTPRDARILSFGPDGAATIAKSAAEFAHLFRAPSGAFPALWHWPYDVDGDGKDDLHVPVDEGILVLFGEGKGAFAAERALCPVSGARVVDDASGGAFDFVRSYPRPVFENLSGSAALELAWFDDSGLAFLPQTAPRKFATEPQRFALNWLSGAAATGLVEQTDVTLADIDKNGLADLLLSKMQAKDGQIADMQTTLVCLLNDGTPAAFGREPALALKLKGVIGSGPKLGDVDGDGRTDLVFGTYAGGLGDALARVFSFVPVTMYVHRGTGKSKPPFSQVPDFSIKSTLPSDDFERWGARASLALHVDVNGDGIADFFTMSKDDENRTARVKWGAVENGRLTVVNKSGFAWKADGITNTSFRALRGDRRTALILARETSLEIVEHR